MKKRFRLTGLDCAVCAARLEDAIRKTEGVRGASVGFLTQSLMIDADDTRFDAVLDAVTAVCRRVEPECVISR